MSDSVIISTTLTGSNEAIIGDALASVVDQVDACLVIDTGVQDATIHVAREVCGDKLILRRWAWRNDYGAARNAALEFAGGIGADWTFTVDPDERLRIPPGFQLADYIDALPAEVGLVLSVGPERMGSYTKERCIRLASLLSWEGVTHEMIAPQPGNWVVCNALPFDELDKTEAQLQAKHERDRVLLGEYVKSHPEARWWYYYGAACHNTHHFDEAVPALRKVIEQCGFEGYGRTATYRLAQCYAATGRQGRAQGLAERALAAHPGDPDFQFLRDGLRQ